MKKIKIQPIGILADVEDAWPSSEENQAFHSAAAERLEALLFSDKDGEFWLPIIDDETNTVFQCFVTAKEIKAMERKHPRTPLLNQILRLYI